MRRDKEYVGRKMTEMEFPEKRKRGRSKRKFLNLVKEDMREVGAKETYVEDRKVWRKIITWLTLIEGKGRKEKKKKKPFFKIRLKFRLLVMSVEQNKAI